MSDETARLKLVQLVSLQELNAVTWNEALAQLDALVDLYLLGQFVNAPPSSPNDGDAYLVGGAPTGAWSGYAYKIASCLDGAWRFYTPFNGLRAYVATSSAFVVYLNGAWFDWNSLISASEMSIVSAATCDLGAAGSLFVQITGTTSITSFGTAINKLRYVRFAQSLTLGHNATSLVLLGNAARITAPGDSGIYTSDASGNWRERAYFRAAVNAGDAATKTGTETLTNKTFGSTLYIDDTNRRLGVGVSAPQAPLDFGTNSITGRPFWLMYNNNGVNMGVWRDTPAPNVSAILVNFQGSLAIGCSSTAVTPAFGTEWVRFRNDGSVTPGADNTQPFGSASLRWSVIYAGTGTINTSGAATKTDVRALTAAEIAVAKALAENVRVFRFVDAVARKVGAARLHTGMIFEDVLAAFEAEGLDPMAYGIVCRDAATKTVPKRRTVQDAAGVQVEEFFEEVEPDLDDSGAPKWTLGLRYGELAQFVLAGLAARLAALEAK